MNAQASLVRAGRVAMGLAASVLPARCLLCAGRASDALNLCSACLQELAWIDPATSCELCAAPVELASRCAACVRDPPAFCGASVALRYQWPVDWLVAELKYRGCRAAARTCAEAVLRRLQRSLTGKVGLDGLIVTVPLHPTRLAERGFDQCSRIARWLAGAGVAVAPGALSRSRPTAPQSSLARYGDRARNVADAFVVRDAAAVRGQAVWLLDDVVTSGATTRAAAGALVTAGATSVRLVAVARAVPE